MMKERSRNTLEQETGISHFYHFVQILHTNGQKFLDSRAASDDINRADFFLNLTYDEYQDWKAEEMIRETSAPKPAKTRDQVADFKKGIKRDPGLFPHLKHIDNWNSFKRETLAQANAQDVADVFNPAYQPMRSGKAK
jgi:hypothetical protein